MYYATTSCTWAVYEDLIYRFGQEFVDKLGTRTYFDETLKTYIADESRLGRYSVIELALDDARQELLKRLACHFKRLSDLDFNCYPVVKLWHIKLTIEALKAGGDCSACGAFFTSLNEELKCITLCDENGENCLESAKSFSFVTKAEFPCEGKGRC